MNLKWREPVKFSIAKASTFKLSNRNHGKLSIFFLILFLGLGFLISNRDPATIMVISIIFSIGIVSLICIINYIPSVVHVNENGIVGNGTLIPYESIKVLVVGSVVLNGKDFDILSITGIDGGHDLFGLTEDIDGQELRDIFREAGVNVQDA